LNVRKTIAGDEKGGSTRYPLSPPAIVNRSTFFGVVHVNAYNAVNGYADFSTDSGGTLFFRPPGTNVQARGDARPPECAASPVARALARGDARPPEGDENIGTRRVVVYDLGQNIAGWAQLRVSGGRPGTEIVMRYGERLKDNSEVDQSHIGVFIKTDDERCAVWAGSARLPSAGA
jgi:hypothetical protein